MQSAPAIGHAPRSPAPNGDEGFSNRTGPVKSRGRGAPRNPGTGDASGGRIPRRPATVAHRGGGSCRFVVAVSVTLGTSLKRSPGLVLGRRPVWRLGRGDRGRDAGTAFSAHRASRDRSLREKPPVRPRADPLRSRSGAGGERPEPGFYATEVKNFFLRTAPRRVRATRVEGAASAPQRPLIAPAEPCNVPCETGNPSCRRPVQPCATARMPWLHESRSSAGSSPEHPLARTSRTERRRAT